MKLHLCCGNVYLDGYVNVDIYIDGKTKYACHNPELVEQMKTTLGNYYKFEFGNVPMRQLRLVDRPMDLRLFFPTEDGPYEQIVMVQGIEHFFRHEAIDILKRCWENLIEKGQLLLDFPDVLASAKMIEEGKDELAMRYVYCSGRDQYSVHKWGWTFEMMEEVLKAIGFSQIDKWEGIEHQYPTIGVRAVR